MTEDQNNEHGSWSQVERKEKKEKPKVLLVGTSNTEQIKTERLSAQFDTMKKIAYHIDQAEKVIDELEESYNPDVIAYHILSNELTKKSSSECVLQLEKLIQKTKEKRPDSKIVVSLATNRSDERKYNLKVNTVNSLVKEMHEESSDFVICDNHNLSVSGEINKKFINNDGYHLSDVGVKVLAANIRKCVDQILGVRRKDGEEYEPGTLTGVQNSIDRHLKDNKSMIDIKKDKLFDHSRKILETKPNPTSLLNTVWFNNGVFFAFRGRQEHSTLLLGDLEIKKNAKGLEFVEFNERTTKTRTGAKAGDERPVAPKMFAQEDNDNCPIRLLKLYLSKRPSDLKNDPNSRFYLRPLVNVNVDTEVWYSHQPLGKNKLGEMMKMMANQAQLSGRKVNHSTRKTFASSLLQSERPITEVAQLGGWKSVSTLTHYNTPSIKQQNMASNIIAQTAIPDLNEDTNSINEHSSNIENADVTCNTAVRDENFNITDDITVERYCTPSQLHSVNSNTLAVKNRQETNPFNILCGASVTGGTVNINIFSGKRKFESSQE
ncbi:unnamed protein product [Mytilus edulis]|uniref:ZMYM2-like/QRICH1 C-terminal domain-containing protein n=1 Tax=Mytilus edulis TaxID=6550 RepID=A0A8S3QLS0_MYTED|nr:unnamed protein product [Mytilus edulis]